MRTARAIVALAVLFSFPAASSSGYSSTSWTCEQQDFDSFVRERFFRAINRAGMRRSSPRGFPYRADRAAISAGLIEGQQRFFPSQPDVKIRLLAFSMCETEGNSINVPTRWGREIGWTGWNIHSLRDASIFYGISLPRSDSRAIALIRSDHRFCGFLTMAACAANSIDMGGFEHALAVKTFGFRGFRYRYNRNGPDIRTWPFMRNYRKWLSVAEVAYQWDGIAPVSAKLYSAMSSNPATPPDRRIP